MKRLIVIIGVLALSIIFGGVSYAATVTANFEVRATIVPDCTVSTAGVDFGNLYVGNLGLAIGGITVNCPNGSVYNVALDCGLHCATSRRMSTGPTGTVFLGYYLYRDAHIQWGDSDFENTYPGGTSLGTTGTGSLQTHTVYAETDVVGSGIPTGTVLTDTVTVTVHY
jgi:spore coat protein U-like protein